MLQDTCAQNRLPLLVLCDIQSPHLGFPGDTTLTPPHSSPEPESLVPVLGRFGVASSCLKPFPQNLSEILLDVISWKEQLSPSCPVLVTSGQASVGMLSWREAGALHTLRW